MEQKVLRDLGFSEREGKVYLALLELGETKVGSIAAKTRLQHSKVYQTLEKLIDRGLVTYVIHGKIKHFHAQDPKQILSLLKEKERGFLEILPLLEEKQKQAKSPQTARVYEGYPAIKAMYEELLENLDKNSYYYVFAFKDEYLLSPLASRFLRNVHMKLSEKKVDDCLIAHSSIKSAFLKNYADIKKIKYKFTSLKIPFGLMIIDGYVINLVWGDRPTAIVIVSKQIADQYKEFFLEIWRMAK